MLAIIVLFYFFVHICVDHLLFFISLLFISLSFLIFLLRFSQQLRKPNFFISVYYLSCLSLMINAIIVWFRHILIFNGFIFNTLLSYSSITSILFRIRLLWLWLRWRNRDTVKPMHILDNSISKSNKPSLIERK